MVFLTIRALGGHDDALRCKDQGHGMSLALNVVRLLRRLPHTARFDRHLDDCAAYEVWYREADPDLPPLTAAQALGLVSLGSFYTAGSEIMRKRVELSVVVRNDRIGSRGEHEPLNAA